MPDPAPDNLAVLAEVGVRPEDRLGFGGEAVVYAVDDDTVVRVPRGPQHTDLLHTRIDLLAELHAGAGDLDIGLPEVLDQRMIGDLLVVWERRLPGTDGAVALERLGDDLAARERLVRSMLDATAKIGRLRVERPWCGFLFDDRHRAPTTRDWLQPTFADNLRRAGPDLAHVDATTILDAVPLDGPPALVHFDAFPGNVMAVDDRCTAVIDFGPLAAIADARLDLLMFAAYLDTEISPAATDRDRAVAVAWLDDHGLGDLYEAGRRFGATFWCAVEGDSHLSAWVRRVLA